MNTGTIHDFPDRFSPMLVKELRQSMRAKTFTGIFLGMQLVLGVILLGALFASESERTGSNVSNIIITFFVICVVLIQPLRGMHALANEIRDQTIDLMSLTRLTAWRIVMGKWISLVSQSALLFTTIIPYLILRYFFGGMNLFEEMATLVLLFFVSMALTAFSVGISACTLAVVRSLFPIAIIFFGFGSLASLPIIFAARGGGMSLFGGMVSTGQAISGLGIIMILLVYLGHQALSMGASLIAPAAENHAITRRIITIAMILVIAMISLADSNDAGAVGMFGILLITFPAIIIALTENNHVAPGVVRSFLERGFPGKVAAIFLMPGIASGYFFTLLIAILTGFIMIILQLQDSVFWGDPFVNMLGFWGTLLFPAVLQAIFHHGKTQRIGPYVLILLATLIIYAILASFSSVAGDQLLMFFAWCPVVFAFGDVDSFSNPQGGAIIAIVMFLINGFLAIRASREIKALFRFAAPPTAFPK